MIARMVHLARRGWQLELAGWRSLWRFVTRRGIAPAGADRFSNDKPIRPILLAFVAISAVEVPIVDLLVHPWPWIRIPLLALGIWGVTFMVGMLLGGITRPHTVGPDGLRVRHGDEFEIELPWESVASVARHRGARQEKTFTLADGMLTVVVQDGTAVEIATEAPVSVRLPSGERGEVDRIRIHVDDVPGFLDAVRRHLRDWEQRTPPELRSERSLS